MASREQNERKFGAWTELPDGGRRYWLEIPGHHKWRARYLKRWTNPRQRSDSGRRFTTKPANGSKSIRNFLSIWGISAYKMITMPITRKMIAEKIAAYQHHQMDLPALIDWAEQQMMEADFDSTESRDAAARLGLADVRAFGLTWDECEDLLRKLGFNARIEIMAE